MFEKIKEMSGKRLGWAISSTSPEELSNSMLANNNGGGLNLNALSYRSSSKLLRQVLMKGYKVKRILLDQLGPPALHIKMMKEQCGSLLSDDIDIRSESKADDKYPVVSAASIVAKVSRDLQLNSWVFKEASSSEFNYDHEFGCGYPSDPKSK